jgi:hypothetical protein
VSSFINGYYYVIVCPFLYHDWDMCCKWIDKGLAILVSVE